MKFPFRVVTSLTDATRNFEALETSGTLAAPGDLFLSAASLRSGCLLCDGSVYSPSTYPALFSAIGNTYGGTSASPLLPDYRGRVIVGAGTGAGLTARSRGQTGGEETHLLTVGEMPSHTHPPGNGGTNFLTVKSGSGSAAGLAAGTVVDQPTVTGSAGGGGAHNNMQPFGVANVFIKT